MEALVHAAFSASFVIARHAGAPCQGVSETPPSRFPTPTFPVTPHWQGLRGTSRDAYGRLVLGDIITAINGTTIKNGSDLYRALDGCEVGETVSEVVGETDGGNGCHAAISTSWGLTT